MILFLTLVYIAILLALIKTKVIRPTIWWKLSPVAWAVFLLVALFIPLQFWAPSGPLMVGNYTVSIVPRVSGEVTEVKAIPNEPMKLGDVLFTIDPAPYLAVLDDAKASLELSQIRFEQEKELARRDVGRQLEMDRARAQLAQDQARYDKAKYDLDATIVRAPSDGFATNIALRPGSRVVALPVQPAMAFVESGELIVGAQVWQNHLRYIGPGQKAEIAFKMYPGRVFGATVQRIVPATATSLESPTGLPTVPQEIIHAPFFVRIKLGDQATALNLPSGATGRVAIYSEVGVVTHIIRMVEIRIEAIMNYFNPF